MKIDEVSLWEAFQGVAVYGNFSKASRILKIPLPQLSKRIAKLEDRLGMKLFRRSTRVVALTDEGKVLLPKVTAALEDLSGLETTFDDKQKLSGTIRITSVPFVAHRLLIPVIREFTEINPEIQIELDLSESLMNLTESGLDLAIRIHDSPEDSSLIYRKLIPNRLVLCVSPHYLSSQKRSIKRPEDLREHKLLMLDVHEEVAFKESGLRLGSLAQCRGLICENGWFLTQLALDGFGVLVRSYWDIQEDLHKKALVQVLKKHPLEDFGYIYAVIPSRRFLAPRVRAFLDFVIRKSALWMKEF